MQTVPSAHSGTGPRPWGPGRRPAAAHAARVGFALLAVLVLGACAQHRELYPVLDRLVAAGKYDEAVAVVEKAKPEYGSTNEVLWNMDLGVYYNYAGRYQQSNEAFERAEKRIDALFTESVSGNVLAFISNDNTLPYKGEDFESVVINIYRALNYAELGNVEAALVEARKVDEKLKYVNGQYPANEQNGYKEDAFARLLMGAFYEVSGSGGDLNDAFISNRLATGIYDKAFYPLYRTPVPGVLKQNLLTTAAYMGREELEQSRQKYPGIALLPEDGKRQQGQVYFVHFAGRAPVKVESGFAAVMPDGNIFNIRMPKYRPMPYLINGSRVLVDGQVAAQLEVGHPTGAIAMQSLEDRIGRIRAKAIARAVTKYMAARVAQAEARKRGGEGAGLLAYLASNVYNVVSEQADLRAWQTLPDEILIGRVLLPPGKHKITVQYLTGGNAVVATRELGEVEVQAGRTRFFVLHTNT
jgi:hypothetical protein